MVASQDDAERQEIVKFISAVIAFAEQAAVAATEFLESLPAEVRPDRAAWPKALLLELSAAITLANWDGRGIRVAIEPTLPSPEAAWRGVLRRLQEVPSSFIDGEAPLITLVFRAWITFYKRHRCDALRMTCIFPQAEEEHLVFELTQLLWSCRHLSAGE
jgi:hypothetical protein